MPHLISPERVDLTDAQVVFLAGSIEMGRAAPWQEQVAEALLSRFPSLVVANPRRREWDASWPQSIDHPLFREQVEWELGHLDRADLAVFYFQPETLSPITLMELGHRLAAHPDPATTLVCCPEGFWRRGNIEILLARYGQGRPLASLDDLVAQACDRLSAALSPTKITAA